MGRLLGNFGLLSGEMVARLIAGLAVMTLVARSLGPAGFGIYSWVISLAVLVLPLARFAMDAVVMRRVAQQPDATGSIITDAIRVAIPACLLATAIGFVLGAQGAATSDVGMTVIALAMVTVLISPGEIFSSAVKAREQVGLIAFLRIGIVLIVACATGWAALSNSPLSVFVALRSSEALLLAIAGLIAFISLRPSKMSHRSLPVGSHSAFREGLPLMVASVSMAAVMRVDQVMLGWMGNETELGHYGLAARLAELAWFLPVALQATLNPGMVRNHDDRDVAFDDFMQRIFDSFATLAWPVMVVTVIGTAILLKPIFGQDYAPALIMVLALSATTPLYFLYFAFGTMLTVRGLVWQSAAMAAAAGLTNILLNAVMIPEWGWAGAATATFAAFLIATIGSALVVPQTRTSGRAMLRALNPFGATARLWKLYGHAVWKAKFGGSV